MILAAIHIKCHFNPTHLCLSDNDFLHQAANCAKALVAEFYDTCDSVAHSVCFTHCIISTFSTSITTFYSGFTFQNSSQSKLILIPFHCIEYCVYFSNRCSSGRQSSYILVGVFFAGTVNEFCHILPHTYFANGTARRLLMATDIRSQEIQFKERKNTGNTFCKPDKKAHGGFGRMASDMRATLPAGRP